MNYGGRNLSTKNLLVYFYQEPKQGSTKAIKDVIEIISSKPNLFNLALTIDKHTRICLVQLKEFQK